MLALIKHNEVVATRDEETVGEQEGREGGGGKGVRGKNSLGERGRGK